MERAALMKGFSMPNTPPQTLRGGLTAAESGPLDRADGGPSPIIHSVQPAPAQRPLCVQHAGPGDHPSIHYFLLAVFQAPSSAEFQAQLDEPYYEPNNRLVVKNKGQVVAHVRLVPRAMHFGPFTFPVGFVTELATLPEYRQHGCATELLKNAERRMIADGAIMGLVRTNMPQFFRQRGWTVCGRHSYSSAGPRDILAYLSATRNENSPHVFDPEHLSKNGRQLNIRIWRHVEQAALTRLYAENTPRSFGPLVRSDSYWRWLITRHGYDRIYVAINGPDKFDLDGPLAPIVGYAAMKEGRIVELMTSGDHRNAAPQLLARACGDAIERDFHHIRLDAPPNDPLHQTIVMAGGKQYCHEAESGDVFMVRLFDPLAFVGILCEQMHFRAKAADLSRPCELGLLLNDEKHRFVISRRSVKFVPGKLGRSYLSCNTSQLTQLLLGHLNVKEAVQSGRLEASTGVAAETGAVLFPRLPLWRPPLDDLPA